ncbi:hypothetical protein [Nitratireductor arenosus]|uniref:hypothetical protein n=1 Tax=Nitratireductor arenosus TaxID=2682096 RepID=UPI001AEE6140|nr:hypothetical protein [Nitratireductor arenosus]
MAINWGKYKEAGIRHGRFDFPDGAADAGSVMTGILLPAGVFRTAYRLSRR